MLSRALSFAANCAVGVGGAAARQFRTTTRSTAVPSDAIHQVLRQRRSVSSSPPLLSPSEGDDDVGEEGGRGDKKKRSGDGPERVAMIKRWMKWNQNKTWRYEPNLDLIAKIGKEGTSSPLDQFRDLVPREKRSAETVGRSWSAKELRRKSYDDLHKLWYVLYKEKNMLLTESNLARRHQYDMIQPERRQKVRKSMGAIKQVLGERKRKKIADWRAYLEELEKYEGLVKRLGLEEKGGGDAIEEAMHSEADKLSTGEKA